MDGNMQQRLNHLCAFIISMAEKQRDEIVEAAEIESRKKAAFFVEKEKARIVAHAERQVAQQRLQHQLEVAKRTRDIGRSVLQARDEQMRRLVAATRQAMVAKTRDAATYGALLEDVVEQVRCV